MPVEVDGSVSPSYLRSGRNSPYFDYAELKMGEVKDIVFPDDTRSMSQTFTEYIVEIQEPFGTSTLINCVVSSTFGGQADFVNFTVRDNNTNRPPLAPSNSDDGDNSLGNGSQVLVLCVNGSKAMPLIVGGWPVNSDDCLAENGHNFHFNFNGIDVKVNKEGEFTLTFGGATQTDGTLTDDADPDASGGSLAFTKEGNITVTDATGEQFMQINRPDKTIALTANDEYDVNVTNGHMVIKSTGVLVGGATDAWVKGTTYRNAESQMMHTVSAQLAAAQSALTMAAAAIASMASLMAGGVTGNIPAAGPAATSGIAIAQAGAALGLAKAAIDAFEAGSSGYLSPKNFTD